MSVKGVKLKSESYFSISPSVLELWRKNLGGGVGGFQKTKHKTQKGKTQEDSLNIKHKTQKIK